jgi:hypothetical protein
LYSAGLGLGKVVGASLLHDNIVLANTKVVPHSLTIWEKSKYSQSLEN